MTFGWVIHIRIYASFEELMKDCWLGRLAVGGSCQVNILTGETQNISPGSVLSKANSTYKDGMWPK